VRTLVCPCLRHQKGPSGVFLPLSGTCSPAQDPCPATLSCPRRSTLYLDLQNHGQVLSRHIACRYGQLTRSRPRPPPRPLPPRLRTPRGPRRLGGTAVPDRVRRPGQERVRPNQRAPAAPAVPRQRRASGSHTVPRTARLPTRRR